MLFKKRTACQSLSLTSRRALRWYFIVLASGPNKLSQPTHPLLMQCPKGRNLRRRTDWLKLEADIDDSGFFLGRVQGDPSPLTPTAKRKRILGA